MQIIGTKKCRETRKALRFCAERSIPHQFVDLNQRKLTEGEWRKVIGAIDVETLIDKESAYYRDEGYFWRDFDPAEELRIHPQLLRTPLLAQGNHVAAGCDTGFIITSKDRG